MIPLMIKIVIDRSEVLMDKNSLADFRLPHWNDLPSIPLYLDQVLSLVEEWLGAYLKRDDKPIVTKTMVNNYVKQKFIPAPVKKKYDRLTIAHIFIIAILKPMYTIEEIVSFIHLALDFSGEEVAYDQFCDNIESAVKNVFYQTDAPKPEDPRDPRRVSWSVCNAFACQLYSRKIYLEHAAEEQKNNAEA